MYYPKSDNLYLLSISVFISKKQVQDLMLNQVFFKLILYFLCSISTN